MLVNRPLAKICIVKRSPDFERRRDPTQAEIRAACREIQSAWTLQERARRTVAPRGWN